MIDLLVVIALAIAGYIGWRRGTLLMALYVTGLAAGYVAAWFFYRPVGRFVGTLMHLPPLLAYPIGGMLVLASVSLTFRFATGAVIRRRRAAQLEGRAPLAIDGAGGAVLAAAYAFSIAIIVVWAMESLQGIRGLSHIGPNTSGSVTGRIAASVMRRATFALTRSATGNPLMASMVSFVVSKPDEGVSAVNAVMHNERAQQLFRNAGLRDAMIRGDSLALAANTDVRALGNDPQFVAAAQRLGILDADEGGERLAAQLAARVGPLARSVQSVQDDPEIKRLLDNPDIKAKIDRGDFGALANDPRFNGIADRILQRLKESGQP